MSQKCSECGRESSLGQPFQHYRDCVHEANPKTVMCAGCGNDDPERRCRGCLHNFKPTSHGAGVLE